MTILYDTALWLLTGGIRLAARWNPKARQWVAGRRGVFDRLQTAMAGNTAPVAWFHCASLGEFEQARPVLEGFRETRPGWRVLLTFYSPSGYEVRKDYPHADWVSYLPADTRANAGRFLDTVRPSAVFYAKYEFWHHYLAHLRRRQVPTFLFSAIFRPEQVFFKSYGGFFREMLRAFTHVFVQNHASAALLRGIGVGAVTVAGDTRLDRVVRIADTAGAVPLAEAFKAGQPLLVAGSTWPGDLDRLLPWLNRFQKPLKVIIAPHEIREETLLYIESTLHRPCIRYSKATEATVDRYQVLLVDNIGLLAALYQYGDFAWVGGGYHDGIHSILEPAVFGMPLFFGPDYRKFQEAFDLIRLGAAFSVRDAQAFAPLLERFYTDTTHRQTAAAAARNYIRQNAGATAAILRHVEGVLPHEPGA